jgi:hypothetical protein
MQLEKQVKDVEKFYKSTDVQQNDCKLKGREKSRRASEDMHEEIMRNFNKILNEASASTSSITIIREMLTSVVAASAVIVVIISDVYNCYTRMLIKMIYAMCLPSIKFMFIQHCLTFI